MHVGDFQGDVSDFQNNGLQLEEFDYAFVPYWYLAYPSMKRALAEGVKARTFIATHLPPKEDAKKVLRGLGGFNGVVRTIHAQFPNAIVYPDEMSEHFLAADKH